MRKVLFVVAIVWVAPFVGQCVAHAADRCGDLRGNWCGVPSLSDHPTEAGSEYKRQEKCKAGVPRMEIRKDNIIFYSKTRRDVCTYKQDEQARGKVYWGKYFCSAESRFYIIEIDFNGTCNGKNTVSVYMTKTDDVEAD
jgi:hypothetical protein